MTSGQSGATELADRYLNRCGHHAADEDKLGFYCLVDEFF